MADTDDLSPDARDDRISELEQQLHTLQETVNRQRDTVNTLQKTNQSLIEQLAKKCQQFEISNEKFLTSHGLNRQNNKQRSLSIDVTSYPKTYHANTTESNVLSIYGNNSKRETNEHKVTETNSNDHEMTKTEIAIESGQRAALKRQKDLISNMKNDSDTLRVSVSNLKQKVNTLEQKQKEQCKKLKKFKCNHKKMKRNIELIQKWYKRLEESSLQYLGTMYPKCSNKQLFENCQKGCVDLLEEFSYNNTRKDSILSDVSNSINSLNSDHDTERKKESKISQEIMIYFHQLFRKHIKQTINYANLQQTHNGLVMQFRLLKREFKILTPDKSVTRQLEDFW